MEITSRHFAADLRSHKELVGIFRNLKGDTPKYEILCFLFGKVGEFVLPASLSDWFLKFQNNVAISSSRVEGQKGNQTSTTQHSSLDI
jgi:hypothetical protein